MLFFKGKIQTFDYSKGPIRCSDTVCITSMRGKKIFFHFVCPLRVYDVTSDVTKPFSYISYGVSYQFAVLLFHLQEHTTHNFQLIYTKQIGIKEAFVSCAHYVVMTSIETSQNRFLNICHDFRKIFCLFTYFVSAWCIWLPVTSY